MVEVGYEKKCDVDFDYEPYEGNCSTIIPCPNIQFEVFASDSIKEIHFDFGDGQSASGYNNPAHFYAEPGIYEACVTYVTVNGCEEKECIEVEVYEDRECDVYFEAYPSMCDAIGCERTINFEIKGEEILYANWDFGDGETSDEISPVHRYTQGGEYTVCVDLMTLDSCAVSICETIEVEDYREPYCEVDFDYQTGYECYGCENKAKFFPEVDDCKDEVVKYYWDFGNGDSSEEEEPFYDFGEPGVYEVCLTVLFENDTTKFEEKYCRRVRVNLGRGDCDDIDFEYTLVMTDTTNWPKVLFEAEIPANFLEYKWDFGDGTYGYDQNVVHEYKEKGYYNVCFTAWDQQNDKCEVCKEVAFFPGDSTKEGYYITGKVMADLSRVSSGEVILFSEDDYDVYATTSIENGYYHFNNIEEGEYLLWAMPDFEKYEEFLPTFFANAFLWMGAYELEVDASLEEVNITLINAGFDLGSGIGRIIGQIAGAGNGNNNDRVSAYDHLTMVLTNESNIPAGWVKVDNNGNFSFTGLPEGTYRLHLQRPGMQLTGNVTITIDANNTDHNITLGINETDALTGIDEQPISRVYPNPAITNLYIDLTSYVQGTLEVYSISGSKMKSVAISGTQLDLDVSSLPKGTYVGVIISGSVKHQFRFQK